MKGMYLMKTIGLIAVTVLIVIMLWQDNITTTVLLLVIAVITLYFWRTPRELAYFFIPAIIGPLAETICIIFGAWAYSNPTFIIPIWLPLVWGIAGISMGRLADLLTCFRHPKGHKEGGS